MLAFQASFLMPLPAFAAGAATAHRAGHFVDVTISLVFDHFGRAGADDFFVGQHRKRAGANAAGVQGGYSAGNAAGDVGVDRVHDRGVVDGMDVASA